MVAFVNDKMTIVRHQVRYLALPHEALDQRDIDDTGRIAASAPDDADILRIDIEKRLRRSTHWPSNSRRWTRTSAFRPR